MNWLKIVKIKMAVLSLCLSSLCFSEDTKVTKYDNLLGLVERGKFAHFKNLYVESNITVEQKKELIAMADKIIETEMKDWPKGVNGTKHPQWGNITNTTGKKLKIEIRFISLGWYIMLLGTIPFSFLLFKPLQHLINTLNNLKKIQNGIIAPGSNAASRARNLEEAQMVSIKAIAGAIGLMSLCGLSAYIHFLLMKNGKKILANYKRFKGATKIKQLIQESIQGL